MDFNYSDLKPRDTINVRSMHPIKIYTREDYLNYFISKGIIDKEEDFYQNPDLVDKIQRHWRISGQVGCKFAMHLSREPKNINWETSVVVGMLNNENLGGNFKELVQTVDIAIGDKHVQALSLIFPDITKTEDLSRLMQGIRDYTPWVLTQRKIQFDDILIFEIRIPLTQTVDSKPITMGPFPFFPKTRQSPFLEIAIRTKDKVRPFGPGLKVDDPSITHLADLPVYPLPFNENIFNQMMSKTTILKGTMLDDYEDPRAKANSAFSLPTEYWSE